MCVVPELKETVLLAALVLVAAPALLGGCSTTGSAEHEAKAETGGVEQVSDIRRTLRAACGNLKDITAGVKDGEQRNALITEARNLTADAAENWARFLEQHGGRPPRTYRSHPDWADKTGELTRRIDEMLERTQEGDAPSALQACGAACGKFVRLNEDAGVRRTSDVLFHFRKAAKPLAEPVSEGNLDAVSGKVDKLLQLRNRAMRDPVGGTGSPAEKREALQAFSDAVDAFVAAVRAGRPEEVTDEYGKMRSALETAYDLYL